MEENNVIPNGFKMTELGALPEEWDVVRLGDVAKVKYGKANPKDTGDIPVVGSGGVYYSTTSPLIDYPTIIIGRKGTAGKVWLFLRSCYPSDTTFYLEWKKDINISFLFNYLVLNPLSGEHAKTTLPSLQKPDLVNYPIPLPSLPEQRAIATVLSTVQEAKEKTDAVITATKELKKSLMKHLFTYGPVSLEEAEYVQLKETEIGMVPEEWEIENLDRYCNFTTGKLNSNQAVPNGKYPFFTCSPETYRIDRSSFDCEAVLLAGNNARGIYSVKYYNGKFDAYQRTYVITIKDLQSLDYKYLKNALETRLEELRISSIGTSTKFLTLKILNKLKIPLPPLSTQRKITEILSSIDKKIEADETKKKALEDLFKSLLNILMTGKLRVNHLEV